MNPIRNLALAVALASAATAGAATHELKSEFRSAKLRSVDYENLVGTIKVVPSEGKELLLEYKVTAGGRDEAAARALADSIRFETREVAGRVEVKVVYPLQEHRSYVYREGHRGSTTNTEYMGRRVRVSSGHGDGAELWVDLIAHLPKGGQGRFRDAVGEITAVDVEADLDFDTGSGSISTERTRGRLSGDTGSGSIVVKGHVGRVEADTGSGDVELTGVKGDVDADTGSGTVSLRDVEADEIRTDTGSGRVDIEDSRGSLDADTGSGGVHARGFVAGKRLRVDTGSGGVRIEGDLSAVRDLSIDTGSGGATLRTSKPFDLRLEIETGSGGISVDLPGMSDVREDRDGDEFSAVIGSGAGRGAISTGSGGVRISMRE